MSRDTQPTPADNRPLWQRLEDRAAALLRCRHVREFLKAALDDYSGVDDDNQPEDLCDALVRELRKVERAAGLSRGEPL